MVCMSQLKSDAKNIEGKITKTLKNVEKLKHDRNVHQMAKSGDSDWHEVSKMMQFVHAALDIETLL